MNPCETMLSLNDTLFKRYSICVTTPLPHQHWSIGFRPGKTVVEFRNCCLFICDGKKVSVLCYISRKILWNEARDYFICNGQRVSKSLSGWQFKLGNSKLDWPKTPQPDRITVRPWEAFLSFRYAMRG